MLKFATAFVLGLALMCSTALAAPTVEVIPAKSGDVTVTLLGHATLMLQWNGKVIHIDPVGQQGDYAALPKADLILVTHEHGDHLDGAAIKLLRKAGTVIGATAKAGATISDAVVLKNGDSKELAGIRVDAVPAYNLQHMRSPGTPFHPKGQGNGYVLHLGGLRVYVAGDTEDIPEMAAPAVKGVDVAFLPVNLPYTMTPEMLLNAARLVQPRILYPYHTGDTDMGKVADLLKALPGVETRIRPMK